MIRSVILGVSADLHDAAAAIVVDGSIIAAAEEERFTRRKHEPSMPSNAIAWCLDFAGIEPGELTTVAFHDKPFTTYERILVTHASTGPRGFRSLARAVSSWSRSKLWVAARLERILGDLGHPPPEVVFAEHHLSHAAAAFYPSPFERAALLTFDGVGEWATSSVGRGWGNRISLSKELRFPDSVGLLYSTITAHCGFAVNDGEYKLMGLAPYGQPRYFDALREHVVDLRPDGSIRLDQRWFAYQAGERMASRRLDRLLDGPPRSPDQPLTQREADLAASMQRVIEDIVLAMAWHAHELTGETRACLAGGVALNCVANARLLDEGPFSDVWIQPAAGDNGSAIGAALWAYHQLSDNDRSPAPDDAMSGCLLGPAFDEAEITSWLDDIGVDFEVFPDDDLLHERVVLALRQGDIIGWFRGRMEFGPPRARKPLHPCRPSTRGSGGTDQLGGEAARGLSAIRPRRARRARFGVVRDRSPTSLHVGHRARAPESTTHRRRRTDRRLRPQTRNRTEHDRGVHPRRPLSTGTDRGCRPQRRLPPPDLCVPQGDRMPDPAQHIVQRPRRTHRPDPGRCTPMLRGERPRPARAREHRDRTSRVDHAGRSVGGTVTNTLRQGLRFLTDLFRYGTRTGRWWMAFIIPLLAIAAIAMSAVKVAVPTVVYAFF